MALYNHLFSILLLRKGLINSSFFILLPIVDHFSVDLGVTQRLTLSSPLLYQRVVSVLDHVFCPSSSKCLGNNWPLLSYFLYLSDQEQVLISFPGLFFDARVEMIAPSLSALGICPEETGFGLMEKLKRDNFPLNRLIGVNCFLKNWLEDLIFLFFPLELPRIQMKNGIDLVLDSDQGFLMENRMQPLKVILILNILLVTNYGTFLEKTWR